MQKETVATKEPFFRERVRLTGLDSSPIDLIA
jgi:hypothetical protein